VTQCHWVKNDEASPAVLWGFCPDAAGTVQGQHWRAGTTEEAKNLAEDHWWRQIEPLLLVAVTERLEIVAGTTITERERSTRAGVREAIDYLRERAKVVGDCAEVFVGMRLAIACPDLVGDEQEELVHA
jgi:hypothetical protein